ncbi:MAG: hypothetical protein IJ011_03730 [Clostridia bacterium]|nr:hypothetical protein [Clostridia bacterium]
MPTVISTKKREEKRGALPSSLAEILPYKLYGAILKELPFVGRVEEVRCRLGRRAYLTGEKGNVGLSYVCTSEDMKMMSERLLGGSLYAHRETLIEGYVTVEGGIRVGVCGRAAIEGGKMIGIYDISGLNFRLPSLILGIGEPLCALLRSGGSALVYSPPGVGKTTLLRSVAARMSTGERARRVCVVDTRGELSLISGSIGDTADILLGYPKDKGIEIAARTMNAELTVCDEIGGAEETEAIISAANCGVPLLASAHADSISSLLHRSGIARLHAAAVFSYYVGIRRSASGSDFCYDITKREDADAFL